MVVLAHAHQVRCTASKFGYFLVSFAETCYVSPELVGACQTNGSFCRSCDLRRDPLIGSQSNPTGRDGNASELKTAEDIVISSYFPGDNAVYDSGGSTALLIANFNSSAS
jgi:hypothetical protein